MNDLNLRTIIAAKDETIAALKERERDALEVVAALYSTYPEFPPSQTPEPAYMEALKRAGAILRSAGKL